MGERGRTEPATGLNPLVAEFRAVLRALPAFGAVILARPAKATR